MPPEMDTSRQTRVIYRGRWYRVECFSHPIALLVSLDGLSCTWAGIEDIQWEVPIAG